MSEGKKTTLWDRIRRAVKAFIGKPTETINLGVEIKRCNECDRGDCEQCVYKERYAHLMSLPSCNNCLHNRFSSCGCCPSPKEDIRINCPLWEPKEEETHEEAQK